MSDTHHLGPTSIELQSKTTFISRKMVLASLLMLLEPTSDLICYSIRESAPVTKDQIKALGTRRDLNTDSKDQIQALGTWPGLKTGSKDKTGISLCKINLRTPGVHDPEADREILGMLNHGHRPIATIQMSEEGSVRPLNTYRQFPGGASLSAIQEHPAIAVSVLTTEMLSPRDPASGIPLADNRTEASKIDQAVNHVVRRDSKIEVKGAVASRAELPHLREADNKQRSKSQVHYMKPAQA